MAQVLKVLEFTHQDGVAHMQVRGRGIKAGFHAQGFAGLKRFFQAFTQIGFADNLRGALLYVSQLFVNRRKVWHWSLIIENDLSELTTDSHGCHRLQNQRGSRDYRPLDPNPPAFRLDSFRLSTTRTSPVSTGYGMRLATLSPTRMVEA